MQVLGVTQPDIQQCPIVTVRFEKRAREKTLLNRFAAGTWSQRNQFVPRADRRIVTRPNPIASICSRS
jgi:hypothetical protein